MLLHYGILRLLHYGFSVTFYNFKNWVFTVFFSDLDYYWIRFAWLKLFLQTKLAMPANFACFQPIRCFPAKVVTLVT